MKNEQFKNNVRIYKSSFSKLYMFSLSVIILFLASYSCYYLLSGYDFGLTAILIFAGGFLPLFYCLQMMIGKVSSGAKVEYNEFYKPYKIFYNPTNRGTYAVILNILLTLLVLYLSNLISIGVYSIFHYDNVKEIYDLITSSSLDNTQIIDILNKILNMPNYIYYLLVSRLIPFIFLFSRIKDRLMICYFNLMMPLPLILMNNVNKQMVRENKKFINKFCFKGNMIFISMFAIGYLIAGVLACYFGNDLPDVGYIYIIALAGGLLLSCFILPIVLIGYCFAADRLQPLFLNKIQTQILNLSSNIGDDGSEETNLVKKMLDDLSSKIDDKKNDKDK